LVKNYSETNANGEPATFTDRYFLTTNRVSPPSPQRLSLHADQIANRQDELVSQKSRIDFAAMAFAIRQADVDGGGLAP
jgi:hypothetical protein